MSELRETIQQVIENEPVALFMKGTPQFVMCGNSERALRALREAGAPVERRAGAAVELGARRLEVERRPVRTRLDHRAERVADGDDAGAERDLLAAQAVRIAAPVPTLVAGADDRHDVRQRLDRREDL